MFDKLAAYYHNSVLLFEQPNFGFYPYFHWFRDDAGSKWLGIPYNTIHQRELLLLKSIYRYEEMSIPIHPKVQKWYDFIYLNGDLPISDKNTNLRYILFHLTGTEWERDDLEEAIYGFFSEDSIILWEDQESGLIIEHNPEPKTDESLFLSLTQTLESDFFIKSNFYSGKVQPLSKEWPVLLKEDKIFFYNAMKLIPSKTFHTFEKSFPFILSAKLPLNMKDWLRSQILEKIVDEPELLTAVRHFLQNNSNATLTAKELYIHRNTLQYRLDKFAQKTGVNIKDFNSIITVYLACLLADNDYT